PEPPVAGLERMNRDQIRTDPPDILLTNYKMLEDLLVRKEDRHLFTPSLADNRQDAAHQAGYSADRHRAFAVRHLIEAMVRDAGTDGVALADLPQRLSSRRTISGLFTRPSRGLSPAPRPEHETQGITMVRWGPLHRAKRQPSWRSWS
ncbi:MAG: hypothetical protein ACT4PO_15855, partial [Actinomycetota bacterium]